MTAYLSEPLRERRDLLELIEICRKALAEGQKDDGEAKAALDALREFVLDATATERILDGYHLYMAQWLLKQYRKALFQAADTYGVRFQNPDSLRMMEEDLKKAGVPIPYTIGNAHVAAGCFYRKPPRGLGVEEGKEGMPFYVAAGHERMLRNAETYRFRRKRLAQLAELRADDGTPLFESFFINWLAELNGLSVSIFAIPEGGIWFPGIPGVIVMGPAPEVLLMECEVLNPMGLSLVATQATAFGEIAPDIPKVDMSPRRAPSVDRAFDGALAAKMGGFVGTSNTEAALAMGEAPYGSVAHFLMTLNIAWWRGKRLTAEQAELTGLPEGTVITAPIAERLAMVQYALETPGTRKTLLLDTLSSLKSGLKNAIHTFKYLMAKGRFTRGFVRLDSGSMPYLTVESRKRLDAAGLPRNVVGVMATDGITPGKLKEYIKLPLDSLGIGSSLITVPNSGLVYKLIAVMDENMKWVPVGKLTDDDDKEGPFGLLMPYRVYDEHGMARYDLLALHDESLPSEGERIVIVNPAKGKDAKGKYVERDVIRNFKIRPLLEPHMIDGTRVRLPRTPDGINRYREAELATIWPAHREPGTEDKYRVNFTPKAYELQLDMISMLRSEVEEQ